MNFDLLRNASVVFHTARYFAAEIFLVDPVREAVDGVGALFKDVENRCLDESELGRGE